MMMQFALERKICTLEVETPFGTVHLAGFVQKPDHRSVIFEILSQYAGVVILPEDVMESRENTRPRFRKLDFDVNWTHSDGYCVLAFGERGSLGKMGLGVDLERHSSRRLHLAERFYSAEEAALIASLESARAEEEFFRLWCRKEAFYKCVGGEFFEGTLRRGMLENPVVVGGEKPSMVHFVDVDAKKIGMPVKASLCIAVARP